MSWNSLIISPSSGLLNTSSNNSSPQQTNSTMASLKLTLLLASLSIFLILNGVASYPAIDIIEAFDGIGVCIRNCAQCKKMLGPYFEGQLCADSCVKYRGTQIPDCEDIESITPFLNSELTQEMQPRALRSIPRRSQFGPY